MGRLQWSPDGSRILFTRRIDEQGPPIGVVEANGSRLWGIEDVPSDRVSRQSGPMRTFDVSADGSRIVYSTCGYAVFQNEGYEIVVSNIDGTDTRRLTDNDSAELYPVWSPDGARVAFLGRAELTIYTVATGEWTSVPIDVAPIRPAWSPDGRSLAFLAYATRPAGYSDRWGGVRVHANVDVHTVGPDGSGLRMIISNAASAPSWSPDGERIAVATFEGDGAALYTFAADGSDPVMVVRVDTKDIVYRIPWRSDPIPVWVPNVSWSPDGSKIMYGALSAVSVADGSVVLDTQLIRFEWVGWFGTRRVNLEDASAFPLAAWSPDSSRIAVLVPPLLEENPNYQGPVQGRPLLYTMSSDGTDPRILVGVSEGVVKTWPLPVRPPADVEVCSNGVVVPNPKENTGLVEDCRTLLRMRDKIAGSGGPLHWNSDRRINRWAGVGVWGQPPRVRTLAISGFSGTRQYLYGQIPPEIGNLVELRELTIAYAHINGRIPKEIGKLANLESLEVTFTHMGGSIPAEIGDLTNLKRLVLTDSQFSGSIPAETGKLLNLEVLVLLNNYIISGHIPLELGNLTNLRELVLTGWYSSLTGPIPPELGSMASLEVLALGGNRLSGSIPAELGNLTNLTSLSLSDNKLSGCIPRALRNLQNLEFTDLDRLELGYC